MTDGQKLLILIAGGIALAAALAGGGYVATEYWLQSANAQKWAAALAAAEKQYGIPSGLLSRIAYEESHFITSIINGTQASSAGALGMMQLMPQYFSTVNVPIPFTDSDTLAQIDQAAQLLSSLYQQFQNWPNAIAAYNAGAGTVQSYLNGNISALPQQTQTYVAQITADLPNLAVA